MKVLNTAFSARRPIRPAAWLVFLAALLVGCGGEDAAEEERRRQPTLAPPVTAAPIVENTADPAENADDDAAGDGEGGSGDEGSGDDPDATPLVVELPSDGDIPVIQIARIENTPWEPQILAQMTPHFSVQASGLTVFSSPYGESNVGWHQTVLSQADVLSFLRLLVDDIGVLDINGAIPESELRFATLPDGSPDGCEAYGVIAVRTAANEGRMIISECELENPTGEDIEAKQRLGEVVNTIERWKYVVDHSGISPDNQAAFRHIMGWYSGIRQPYTPETAVGFGTRARGSIPSSAAISGWPLELPLGESFDADFGSRPVEIVITGADLQRALQSSLAFALERPRSFWGPLYADQDRTLYSVGFRPSVPGSNNVVVDYDYVLPRRGIGAGQ